MQVYVMGAALAAGWLVLCNARFRLRLRQGRRPHVQPAHGQCRPLPPDEHPAPARLCSPLPLSVSGGVTLYRPAAHRLSSKAVEVRHELYHYHGRDMVKRRIKLTGIRRFNRWCRLRHAFRPDRRRARHGGRVCRLAWTRANCRTYASIISEAFSATAPAGRRCYYQHDHGRFPAEMRIAIIVRARTCRMNSAASRTAGVWRWWALSYSEYYVYCHIVPAEL